MNRSAFYAALRRRDNPMFGTSLSQPQVNGLEAILDECQRMRCDLWQTAYILSTAYGETGGRMQPVRENLNYSATRLMQVWPTRFPTTASTRGYARNPKALANRVYNGRMGNRTGTDDGWNYRGGGIGQVTGRENYAKFGERIGVNLLDNPALLERLDVSVKALVRPMMEGWATGKALPQFVEGAKRNYLGARQVWGGVDPYKYADNAKAFEKALEAGGWQVEPPHRPDVEPTPPATSWIANLIRLFFGRWTA